jgi:hypothetical protein
MRTAMGLGSLWMIGERGSLSGRGTDTDIMDTVCACV